MDQVLVHHIASIKHLDECTSQALGLRQRWGQAFSNRATLGNGGMLSHCPSSLAMPNGFSPGALCGTQCCTLKDLIFLTKNLMKMVLI